MAKNIKDFGLDFKDITQYEAGEITDKEMIRKDFRKALFITILSIISSSILAGIIYLL